MSTEITHEKTPDTHSSIVGGSSASRILGCPGSVDLLAKIDEQIDAAAFGIEMEAQDAAASGKTVEAEELFASAERMRASKNASSSYADEGTGLHEIMAYLVENDVPIDSVLIDEKVDQLFDQYKLHDDRMWDAVLPAYRSFLAYLDTLYESDDDEVRIRVESKVIMPGIISPIWDENRNVIGHTDAGAFGTCDVLIRAPKKTVVWDWKFGQGVPVLASYKTIVVEKIDGVDTDVPTEFGNDQLMFYARAAMQTYVDYFVEDSAGKWPVDLVICQPRILDEELSTFTTTTMSLETFRLDLVDAVEEALSGKGRKAKGSYCRFAKCKAICPLHLNGPVAMAEIGEKLGKLRNLTALANDATVPLEPAVRERTPIEYAEALAMMLDLAEIVEPYIKEATAQAHAFMEAGGEIPHYKLVPKKAGWDSWADEKKTDAFLGRQGLSVEERRKPWQSITPAVARKHLKAKGDEKGLKLLEKYVQPGVSSGTTIAPSDDPREAVQATATMVKSLADKIASLGT
jgi:hypothetical protein